MKSINMSFYGMNSIDHSIYHNDIEFRLEEYYFPNIAELVFNDLEFKYV